MSNSSRYASCTPLTFTRSDGSRVGYLEPRICPRVADVPIRGYADRLASDRIDRLANRALGDPLLFWRLCDANGVVDPLSFGAAGPGRVSVPEPVPGG